MKRPHITFRIIWALFLGLIVLAYAGPAPEPIRFAVIGDRTGGHVPGVYEEIVQEIERMRPDFVVSVGDQIEGYTADTTELNREWRGYRSIVAPLTMPLYLIPGNHDISTDAQLPMYERYVGKPWSSFDYQDLHFTILDASRAEASSELPKEEIAWLINDLKQSKAKYKFVFYHKPFWLNTLALGKPDTLNSIFRNYGVSAVFNGHIHQYFSAKYDGILYTTVGSSGGATEAGPTGLMYHFAWVTVDKDGISISPIKMGSVLPWDEVTAADMVAIDRIDQNGMRFVRRLALNQDLAVADTLVAVQLKNTEKDAAVDDTLRWDVPVGWSVSPRMLPVKLAAGESTIQNFVVRDHAKSLFPVPSVSVRFPYDAMGRTTEVENSLPMVREASCYPGKPVMDGEVKETEWQGPVTKLFDQDGDPMKTESTEFYFAYDANNLYVAARCLESKMDSLVALTKDRDGPVYAEDCVGYFLQPDIDKLEAYQIYFNPLGTAFDQKITETPGTPLNSDRSWNGSFDVATYRGKDYWSVEVKIPLAQFGVTPHPGLKMGLEFRRKQKRLNSVSDWQVPLNPDPRTYGVLVFR